MWVGVVVTVLTVLGSVAWVNSRIDSLRSNNEVAHDAIGKNIKRRTSRRRIQRIVRGVTKELTAPPPAKPGPGPKSRGESN
jgi:hypothetical protein